MEQLLLGLAGIVFLVALMVLSMSQGVSTSRRPPAVHEKAQQPQRRA